MTLIPGTSPVLAKQREGIKKPPEQTCKTILTKNC